jgi:hypothetical protein
MNDEHKVGLILLGIKGAELAPKFLFKLSRTAAMLDFFVGGYLAGGSARVLYKRQRGKVEGG